MAGHPTRTAQQAHSSEQGPWVVAMKKVCIVGLGYIVLPTASVLANKGFDVLGCDIRSDVLEAVGSGRTHILEPDLEILVRAAVNSKRLRVSATPEPSDIFMIAVPTPVVHDNKPDLSYVEAATLSIVPALRPGNLVILESTSPPGTCEDVLKPILSRSGLAWGQDLFLAYCPERVLPGRILVELVQNDRIVGGIDPVSTEKAREFYSQFVQGHIYASNSKTAEMVKLVENASRDVGIAFVNELSMICARLGLDVWEVIELANKHPRVNLLKPGPGVGGHCIAVDPWFIVAACPEEARLIRTAREVNLAKTRWIIEQITEKASHLKDPVVACLGLSYKKNIDDLRESPAVQIAAELTRRKVGEIIACEPHVKRADIGGIPNLSLGEVLEKSDVRVVLVDHEAFRKIPASALHEKIWIDTCGMLQNRV